MKINVNIIKYIYGSTVHFIMRCTEHFFQTVMGVLLLAASSIVIVTQAKVVTQRMEDEMRADLRERMHTDKDENGFRWQTAAWIRACFHDCVMGCDGCIDTRRIFQSSNNG